MNWQPDYTQEFMNRQLRVFELEKNPMLAFGARTYYKDKPHEFIEDWCITYDPRNSKSDLPTIMPFKLFPRQREFIDFLLDCLKDEESGLVEKSRDMGATWLACAFSVWLWDFHEGSAVGWGSRKEQLVDKIGDPDSIFEKIRMILDNLPGYLLPYGFGRNIHCSYMKILNPENGATITGEAGDNIGRGGRKLIYFKDESAHYERPERIEAALGDNTRVQIDISSVHGTANVFARKRQSGKVWYPNTPIPKGYTRVFIFDWRESPFKDQQWYDDRKAKAENEGLLHVFAQEVDRDYSAAVQGTLIPAIWVQAAIDAHEKFPELGWEKGKITSALDVADEGGDVNAQCMKKGVTLIDLDKWGEGDTGVTADRAVFKCREYRALELYYDCIGVGSGVKAETNRLKRENILPNYLEVIKWNASAAVLQPETHIVPGDADSPKNKDTYLNLKAQSWWRLRIRFEKTWKFVTKGIIFPVDEMISIKSDIPYFHELIQELSQPTYMHNGRGLIIVNKKPEGTRSPNLADDVMMVFNPCNSGRKAPVWGRN